MKVAAFQFDVRRNDVPGNLARVEAGLREAADRGVALVVLPEMWPTSFVELPPEPEALLAPTAEAVERLRVLSAELGLVVAGTAFAPGPNGERPRNRLSIFDRGELVLAYDKAHLHSPTGEREAFSAGDAPPVTVETGAGKISGAVCYDLRFASLFRAPFDDGAELLLIPAQWPSPRAAHWRALALGRAVELQCFVVAANRTGTDLVGRRKLELDFPGNSLVVGPGGSVLAEGQGEEGLVEAEIDLGEVERLRVTVPVRRDQRSDLYD